MRSLIISLQQCTVDAISLHAAHRCPVRIFLMPLQALGLQSRLVACPLAHLAHMPVWHSQVARPQEGSVSLSLLSRSAAHSS